MAFRAAEILQSTPLPAIGVARPVLMRNLFDQYDQPENKLTHALVTTLAQDRTLLRPFLRWLGLKDVPPVRTLEISEQQVPGAAQWDLEEHETEGLPDACVFNSDGWAVLIENKVQARAKIGQIRRHRDRLIRNGFSSPHMVVIAVDEWKGPLPNSTIAVTWKDVYCWFSSRCTGPDAFWAREFVEYMQVFERRMLAQEYDIRGTITVFNGLRFDAENPYTYREGKRLLKLLADELQARHDLKQVRVVPPPAPRRPAITGRGADAVWDFLPLQTARGGNFTASPHLTIALHRTYATAAMTVPNGIRGGFRTKLAEQGPDEFAALLVDTEKCLVPVIERSPDAKPMIYLSQGHYRTQKSQPERDGHLEVDLRTAVRGGRGGVKYQPEWLPAIYELLAHKRSNMQIGVEVRFRYDCPIIRSPKAADLFADSWKAMTPLIGFVLDE